MALLPRVCVNLIHTVFYLSHLSLPLYSLWCYNKIYDLSDTFAFPYWGNMVQHVAQNYSSRSLSWHWIASVTKWQLDCYFAVLKYIPCDLQNVHSFLGRCSSRYGNELCDNLCHKLGFIVSESAVYSSMRFKSVR